MTINEINALAKKYNELKKELEELKETLKNETKAHGDTIETDDYTLTVKIIISDKFDSSRFKKENPETAAEYTKESIYERFECKGAK